MRIANLRFSKSQFDIMEKYKPFITKGFVSLIGAKTYLQPIKILLITFFQINTFLDSDFNTLIDNRNHFNLVKTFVRNRLVNLPV